MFTWDRNAGHYLRDGIEVPWDDVRRAIESVVAKSGAVMRRHTEDLVDGKINIVEWRIRMGQSVKDVHLATGMAASGGDRMDLRAIGRIGNRIKGQYKFLDNFAYQLTTGMREINDSILDRSEMYGEAARGTFEAMRRVAELSAGGITRERRRLGSAEHCESCVRYADMGWQLTGTLPDVGESCECLSNCHCRFEYEFEEPSE